jgi:hypothetical protein
MGVQEGGRFLVKAVRFGPLLTGHPSDGSILPSAVPEEVVKREVEQLEPRVQERSLRKLLRQRLPHLDRLEDNLLGARCLLQVEKQALNQFPESAFTCSGA